MKSTTHARLNKYVDDHLIFYFFLFAYTFLALLLYTYNFFGSFMWAGKLRQILDALRMKCVDCTESRSELAIARFESASKVLRIP